MAEARSLAGASLRRSPLAPFSSTLQESGPSERREHDDTARGDLLPESSRRLQAVQARHLDVEERDVRLRVQGSRYDFVSARDVGDYFDVLFEGEEGGERAPNHALILCEQDPDHLSDSGGFTPHGILTRGLKPP